MEERVPERHDDASHDLHRNFAYVVVCIVGGALALSGTISFGTVVAFMIYIRLFTQPLQTIAQAATSAQPPRATTYRSSPTCKGPSSRKS